MALDAFVHRRVLNFILEAFHPIFVLLRILLQLVEPLHALELGPRETDLLPIIASLHRASHVKIVILDNPQDNVRCRDALSSLGRLKFASLFYLCIDIVSSRTAIRGVIMGNIVDFVLFNEVKCDDPRTGANDLIDPSTMAQNVAALFLRHYNFALFLNRLVISGNTNDQMHIGKQLFRLLEDASVTDMIHVEHTVSVNSNWTVRRLCLFGRRVLPAVNLS